MNSRYMYITNADPEEKRWTTPSLPHHHPTKKTVKNIHARS